MDDAWQGASGTTAAAKTATAIANGAEVGAQSDALKGNLATAATNVAQARVRLIEIIAEFQATMAAIGPNIIFPWGWAAAIAAANKAIAMTTEMMTELQTSLGAQAAEVTAAGAPVEVTAAPQLAASSPMSSLASPLMSMATKGAQAGIQAGTGAASAASQAAQQAATAAGSGCGWRRAADDGRGRRRRRGWRRRRRWWRVSRAPVDGDLDDGAARNRFCESAQPCGRRAQRWELVARG